MPYVLIIHAVADYAAWKTQFDAAAGLRRSAGEQRFQVLKHDTDPNLIVHFSRWSSLEAARAFFESDEVAKIRARAGVKAPVFRYLDLLEEGEL